MAKNQKPQGIGSAIDGVTEQMKQEAHQHEPASEPVRLGVTLVRVGPNAYDVLGAGNTPLRCKCGRPIQASLHNKSVPQRLVACGQAVPKVE